MAKLFSKAHVIVDSHFFLEIIIISCIIGSFKCSISVNKVKN